MGQQVSRVYGFLVKRPIQRYNVEHRAAKVISKIGDPKAPAMRAPMFETDKQLIDDLRRNNPGLAEVSSRKDDELFSRLRDVYVTSADPVTAAADPVTAAADPVTAAKSPDDGHEPTAKKVDPTRPLPLDRTQYQDNFVPGLMRIDKSRKTPRGKVSIDNAITFITEHSLKPETVTSTTISENYRLNPETTANTLKYFGIFKAYVPPEKEYKKEFDALEAGKNWVETKQEVVTTMLDYQKERSERRKLLLEKEERRKKQTLLNEGDKER